MTLEISSPFGERGRVRGSMFYLFLFLFILLIFFVVSGYMKDRREGKRRTIETIGDDLWNEIDEERRQTLEKGKKFRKILDETKKHK